MDIQGHVIKTYAVQWQLYQNLLNNTNQSLRKAKIDKKNCYNLVKLLNSVLK